jgi:metallo-beta-lactamase class B
MKKIILIVIFGMIGLSQVIAQTDDKIVIDDDIQLIPLQDSVFIHTTWHKMQKYGRVPSNGMIVIKNGQAIMIDTPMDNDKTRRLTEYMEESFGVSLVKLIAGHYHEDCIGGLEFLQSRGIESIANSMTISKCKEQELPIPSRSFTDSLSFDFNGLQIECRYFGGGHTFDNITVWLPQKQILFGGCLVKSIASKGLGYIGEAVLADWDVTVKKVMDEYQDVEIIVPGHGNYGGRELLIHTIELVEKQRLK